MSIRQVLAEADNLSLNRKAMEEAASTEDASYDDDDFGHPRYEAFYMAKWSELCQNKNIMSCKINECTATNLTAVTADEDYKEYHLWCFEDGIISTNVRK